MQLRLSIQKFPSARWLSKCLGSEVRRANRVFSVPLQLAHSPILSHELDLE